MKTHLLKNLLLFCVLFSCSGMLFAQSARKPVELVQDAIRKNETFTPLRIQPIAADAFRSSLVRQVTSYSLFSFNRGNINAQGGKPIELELPSAESTITLQLVPVNIYAEGFSVRTASGERIPSTGWHYQGIIKGDDKSVAAISIFDNEIAGFIGSDRGNFVVGKLRRGNAQEPANIVYKESALKSRPMIGCGTADISLPVPPTNDMALTNRCVRIYYESEYDFYTAFGNSVSAVTNYITSLFNQNKTLYNNDGVSVTLSGIFVWDTEDPYDPLPKDPKEPYYSDVFTTLAAFQSYRTSFNGDLAQLITTRGIGGGLAAVIYGLCNSSIANRMCVSGNMTTSFPNVPTYSWEVMVTTHELGHLMGSRHTHACVWNGNNTAIDGCAGFTEGGCSVPGIPSGGGTIMSYCHLQSVGINFSNGFGPQPAAQIRNSVEASTCLTTCSEPPTPCSTAPTQLTTYNVTTTTATISCAPSPTPGAWYTFEYRVLGSSGAWTSYTVNGPPLWPSAYLSGLTANTTYEWRVRFDCTRGGIGGVGPYTYSQFTTLAEGVPCGTATGLIGTPDCGFTDVAWNPVPDAQSYTVEYKRTTASVWTVQPNTTYTSAGWGGPAGLYNWRVKVNCAGGTGVYANGTTSILSTHAPQCEPFRTYPKGEEVKQGQLKLQPQPAADLVTLNYVSEVQSPATITIHSQFGTAVLRKQVPLTKGTNTLALDISNIKPGVYIVKLQVEGQAVSQKLVVGK